VTLVSLPGTVISRPQLSRTRYEALPVTASHANETLHDVFPVDRKFNEFAGAEGFPFANDGDSGDAVDAGSVASRHAPAATRIDPARTPERESRSADMDASVGFLMGATYGATLAPSDGPRQRICGDGAMPGGEGTMGQVEERGLSRTDSVHTSTID
jgi:hypothetical protein